MAIINPNYDKLVAGYLFPEINRRVKAFTSANEGVKIYRLGIGNTTEPLRPKVIQGLREGVDKLADVKTYTGYGDEQGDTRLRNAIAKHYASGNVSIDPSEVFVSDGAKSDVANIQSIFDVNNTVAVQDPAYPVYVDTNVIAGRTGHFDQKTNQYTGLIYMPCNEENGFIPNVNDLPAGVGKADLIYLCSPNNPTGAVMNRKSLESFVGYAIEHKSVILFDAAYNWYINDSTLPKSIYEIENAKKCAMEFNSFSKKDGFTGVRLGWTIVPKELVAEDAPEGKLNAMWNGRQTRFFNGASNIAQEGGLAALSEQGMLESNVLVDFYMENARIIRNGLRQKGIQTFGGDNAPYIWMKNPNGMDSWKFFDKMLNEANVVTTPGVGFGPEGQGFTRLSAFGHRENVEAAMESIKQKLQI
ncbi:MAG: LL-diaminopimelate aminotransferase [archaeon]